jgi:hypothetical protein
LFTERIAIKEELEFIREERRRLTDRYWGLMERLKQLDSEERVNGQFIDMDGVVKSFDRMTKDLSEALSLVHRHTPMDQLPEEPADEPIQDNQVADKETVIKQREFDSTITKTNWKDLKKITPIVSQFLKERGVPVKLSTIFAVLEEQGFKWSKTAYSLTMKTIMEYDKKISPATRGYYQYKN